MRRIAAAATLCFAASAAASPPPGESGDRGAYLARAADCVACHTKEGGTPFAGGRAFVLPFGTIYSPNITPDRDTGIGKYSDEDWVRMMHKGIAADGKHLYAAMPYNSYTLMSRDDALAIKAYLFSLPPVHATAPANNLKFPLNQRWLIGFWNLLNNPDRRFEPDQAKSPEWNRGAYLVEALGHCAQCHTPRDATLGLRTRQAYAGTVQQHWLAYNISSDKAHGIGAWSDDALAAYLSTGRADGHGPASGPMAEAVDNSLRFLSPDDIKAMVVYLKSIPAQSTGPEAAPENVSPPPSDPLGAHVYADACAGCHLPSGAGRQSAYAALKGDHTAADPKGTNLVQILAEGSQMHTGQGLVFMHAFTDAYTDPELAAAANYVIATFGGRDGRVTAKQVAEARKNRSPSTPSPGS